MTCRDCTASAKGPWHGYKWTCRPCRIRQMANSSHFDRVRRTGVQDATYRHMLVHFEVMHDEVKAAAERDAK